MRRALENIAIIMAMTAPIVVALVLGFCVSYWAFTFAAFSLFMIPIGISFINK